MKIKKIVKSILFFTGLFSAGILICLAILPQFVNLFFNYGFIVLTAIIIICILITTKSNQNPP